MCAICAKGKAHRLPFPPSTSRETEPLALVHSDLCGPFRVAALGGGFWYFMTMVDDASGDVAVYPLLTKKGSIIAFRSYLAQYERQTGHKVKRFRTDGGGEYEGLLTTELERLGIVHESTTPYTPQSNGAC